MSSSNFIINFDFDVTTLQDVKRAALREHKSQFDENSVEDVLNAFKFEGKFMEKFNYLHLNW